MSQLLLFHPCIFQCIGTELHAKWQSDEQSPTYVLYMHKRGHAWCTLHPSIQNIFTNNLQCVGLDMKDFTLSNADMHSILQKLPRRTLVLFLISTQSFRSITAVSFYRHFYNYKCLVGATFCPVPFCNMGESGLVKSLYCAKFSLLDFNL